jgi:hypothetical protein
VNLSEGRIELADLELDEEVLNELLIGLPLRIVGARAAKLTGVFPYRALLEEGAQFNVDGIRIDVVPATPQYSPGAGVKRTEPSRREAEPEPESEFPTLDVSLHYDDGHESLGFLAQWIDQILSQLRATFTDVGVNFYDGTGSGNFVTIYFDQADFLPGQGVSVLPGANSAARQAATILSGSILRVVSQKVSLCELFWASNLIPISLGCRDCMSEASQYRSPKAKRFRAWRALPSRPL